MAGHGFLDGRSPGEAGEPTEPYRKVFVVGCGRSGTTWVREILKQHPDVVSGPESHLFPVLMRPLRSDRPSPRWRSSVLETYDRRQAEAPEKFGGTGPHQWIGRSTLASLLDASIATGGGSDLAARDVLEGVLDSYFAENGGGSGGALVEKTPRHLYFAADILRWWPEARIVEVVRDGRDVCVSLEHKSRVRSWAPSDRREQIERWRSAVREGMTARTDAVLARRWHVVRYEDLSDDGVREIRRLYDFVGLGYDDNDIDTAVSATSFNAMQRPGSEHHIRSGRAGGWREHFSAADEELFLALAKEELAGLGYPL